MSPLAEAAQLYATASGFRNVFRLAVPSLSEVPRLFDARKMQAAAGMTDIMEL
jgi:hypothetical protein